MAHVINLATIDVMSHITKTAVVENKAAIWEYDPALPSNRISNGGLDVIATIRTLAIKVSLHSTFLGLIDRYLLMTDPGIERAHREVQRTPTPNRDHEAAQDTTSQ